MIVIKTIDKHISSDTFSDIYLLYGDENYLKKLYRDRLSQAILKEPLSGNMNYRYYNSGDADPDAIAAQAATAPFFSDTMLIVVEDSGLFKRSSSLAEELENRAEETKIIFIENEVDKRNSLYKYIKANGFVCEINHLNDNDLLSFIAGHLGKSGCMITKRAAIQLINKVGTDMLMLINEMDKLSAYAGDTKQIDIPEVEAVCTTMLSGKIFQMMDYIVSGKRNEAISLYNDLIALKENPSSILYLLTRHLNMLLIMKENIDESDAVCAKKMGVPPFSIKKYRAQQKAYSRAMLLKLIDACVSTDEDFKTGKTDAQMGTLMLIVKLSGDVSKRP